MELRLAVLFGLYCFLLFQRPYVVFGNDKIFVQKRFIVVNRENISETYDGVEGSGVPAADINKFAHNNKEIFVSSGSSPDDEDGDVDDGSGSPDDELEGSGGAIVKSNTTLVASPPLHTTTTTVLTEVVRVSSIKPTDKLPPRRPVEDDSNGIPISKLDEDHSILIEDSSTVRTAPPFKPSSAVRTTIATPATRAGEEARIYFGVLFKPGILAAVIGGFVVGILAAILLVMFIVYRMRKKDEGSYALDEQKQPPIYPYAYQKAPTKEFYA